MQEKAMPDPQRIIESLPGLYLVLSNDFIILNASNAYLKATMTKREDIIGRYLFEVFPDNPDDQKADGVSNLRASLNEVLQSRKSHTMAVQQYDIRRPDGKFEERFWNPVNTPVLDEKGEVACIIHQVEEVTELVKTKSGLKKRTHELESLSQEFESFTYSISHDLRAPLRAINGYATMIEEDYGNKLDEEGKRFARVIKENAQKMGELIDDLLAFSHLGRQEIRKSQVDMNELVNNVVTEIKNKTTHPVNFSIASLHPITADYSLMTQAMSNLLTNAVKYSSQEKNPEVNISSSLENGKVTYTISDNGVGFDMQYIHKLFGVFQRLHDYNEFPGTGMGLAIVSRIVHKHGGEIKAVGEPGKGATFYISLPNNQR